LAIGYLSEAEFNEINKKLEDLANQVGSFIAYLENKKKINSPTRQTR
jgi:tetrahydromethanopterin S-methyltransferase subunit G